jgi:acyl-CoA thioester hydrolase
MVTDTPDQPATGRFVDGVHRLPARIYFEDTDAGGLVYHTSHLRLMERARTEMLRVAGISHSEAMQSGIGFYIVAELAIRYRRPARLDDVLSIESRLTTIKAISCVIQQRVMRGEELVSEADVTVVFVGFDGRPKRQPAAWIETFRRLQGETGPT